MNVFQRHGQIIVDEPKPVNIKLTLPETGQSKTRPIYRLQAQKSPLIKWALGKIEQI
jgi:hypothetical protein